MVKGLELSDQWASQTTWGENIAAVLTSFCRIHGIKIAKKTIFNDHSIEKGMANFGEIINFCKKWEFDHLSINFVREHLQQQFLPAFVLMKGYSTRLVMYIQDNSVFSIDATKGWMEETIDEFFEKSMESIVLIDTSKYKEDATFAENEKADQQHIEKIRKEFGLRIVDDFLTSVECEKLIELGQGSFQRSKVLSSKPEGGSVYSEVRTSSSAFLIDKNPFYDEIRQKAAKLVDRPKEHFESVQLTTYGRGQLYDIHNDAFSSEKKEALKEGQRTHTVLVYLNDSYTGGGTTFPALQQVVTAKVGRAVVWSSLKKDRKLDNRAYHGGLPVLDGQKYICNLWVRDTPQKNWE